MAVVKRVLCRQRLRQVPPQFSWIDHRLVRDKHIQGPSADALALYLFLVTVCDGRGLSYYAGKTICQLLLLDAAALAVARGELIAAGLIAYQSPLYQVLALNVSARADPRPVLAEPVSVGQVLREMTERAT